MPNANPASRSVRLNMECLEDRAVPAFGLSLAAGHVIQSLPNAGTHQYVTGTGPGTRALVRIFDNSGNLVQSFHPFGDFTGGVQVAVGRVDVLPASQGQGVREIIVGTDPGTTAQVKVFVYINGGLQRLASFKPFGPNFTGGVNVATGIVTGANLNPQVINPENLVVSVASNGPPRVNVYSYDANSATGVSQIRSFLAYPKTYTGGVNLTVGPISPFADGGTATMLAKPINSYAQIITGMAQDASEVRIFDAQNPTVVMDASYMAFPGAQAGITLVAGDTTGTRGDDIYVNLIGTSQVRIFVGETSALLAPTILDTFNALPGSGSKQLSMAISGMATTTDSNDNVVDNNFAGSYFIHDLLVVSATGPNSQAPRVWYGGALPAGFNGSTLA